jgi:hypothetical protein
MAERVPRKFNSTLAITAGALIAARVAQGELQPLPSTD